MSTFSGPVREVPLSERRAIVEGVLSPSSPLHWEQGGAWAYVECPGIGCHSNSNGRRDCRVYADESPGRTVKPPGLYCLHTSCAGVLAELNRKIRSEIGKAKVRGMGRADGKPASTEGGAGGSWRAGPRTARTDFFTAPAGGEAQAPTARTDIPKPLERFARAQVRAHAVSDGEKMPSGPSAVASPARAAVALMGAEATKDNAERVGPKTCLPFGEVEGEVCTLIVGQEVQRLRWRGGEWVEV